MYITSVCNRWTIKSKLVAMIFYLWLSFSLSEAQTLKIDVFPLINDACLHCHDSYTQTELNFENLSEDLTQSETFRQWEKIFDRVTVGEMPPQSEPRPGAAQLEKAPGSLEKYLRDTNLAMQSEYGRVPWRRLTRLEKDNSCTG